MEQKLTKSRQGASGNGDKMNKVVKILILSDIAVLGAAGFINPIFAIFVNEQIIGGSIAVAGLSASIYIIIKSIFQIPIGRYVDEDRKDKNDFWFMVVGSILIAVVPFMYAYSLYPWHIYVLQAIAGLGAAMAFPTWMALFTRHIDKFHEGYEWGVYNTVTGLAAGVAAVAGGFLAEEYGFNFIFYLAGAVTLLGAAILFIIYGKFRSTTNGGK